MARDSLTLFLRVDPSDRPVISIYRGDLGAYYTDTHLWRISRRDSSEDKLGPECMVTWND